jgi:small nuclear ribonucleoprotein (snRNP)-like protein
MAAAQPRGGKSPAPAPAGSSTAKADDKAKFGASVPFSILLETQAAGYEVGFEMITGYSYKGKIQSIDEQGGIVLREATITNFAQTKTRSVSEVYVRGSQIVFYTLPATLQTDYIIAVKKIKNKLHTEKARRKRALKRARAALGDNVESMEEGGKKPGLRVGPHSKPQHRKRPREGAEGDESTV